MLGFLDPPPPCLCMFYFSDQKKDRVQRSWTGECLGLLQRWEWSPGPVPGMQHAGGAGLNMCVRKLWSPPLPLLPPVPYPLFLCAPSLCALTPMPAPGKTLPSHPTHVASPPRASTPHHRPQPRSVPGWDSVPGAPSPADITHPTPAPGPSAHAVSSAASALTPRPAVATADAAASSVAKGGA